MNPATGVGNDPNATQDEALTTLGYTGHEMFWKLGLVHTQARLYNPSNGRWLSPDPIVPDLYDGQSFNRYSYVLNNPLTYTDPLGLEEDFTLSPTQFEQQLKTIFCDPNKGCPVSCPAGWGGTKEPNCYNFTMFLPAPNFGRWGSGSGGSSGSSGSNNSNYNQQQKQHPPVCVTTLVADVHLGGEQPVLGTKETPTVSAGSEIRVHPSTPAGFTSMENATGYIVPHANLPGGGYAHFSNEPSRYRVNFFGIEGNNSISGDVILSASFPDPYGDTWVFDFPMGSISAFGPASTEDTTPDPGITLSIYSEPPGCNR